MENQRIVGIYVRVSTQGQVDEGYSIDEQTDKLKKYCDIKDWTVYKVYTDGGFSGSNIKRPAMEMMIDDIKAKRINTVLVYKLDRLSRSQKDTLFLIEDVFNKNGVAFISLNENFDTSTAFGKAMVGMLSVFAQLEREQITMRMQMGMLGRAKTGLFHGSGNIPFGYDYTPEGKLIINEATAPLVRTIFHDYLTGEGLTRMQNRYNEIGHPGRKYPWTTHTLQYILKNRTYIGEIAFAKQWFPGQQKPIIDVETFEKAQGEIAHRQQNAFNQRPYRAKYMLSGLLRCGRCGGNMIFGRNGSHQPFYYCENTKNSLLIKFHRDPIADKCSLPTFMMEPLEKMVVDTIMQVAYDDDAIKSIIKEAAPTTAKPGPLKAQLTKLDKSLTRLMDLYTTGVISIEDITKRAEKINSDKNVIKTQLASIDTKPVKKSLTQVRKKFRHAAKNLDHLDYENQKNIVHNMIQSINLTDDGLKIIWRF